MDGDVRFVEAGGLRFGYLEAGSGPLVLLVHGFPDTPYSWDAARAALAQAGFRAVAPFTRGYAPTSVPREERYDSDTLGRDLVALVHALGERSAVVVGHDWGASAAYSAAALEPSAIRRLVTIAIPHPASVVPTPRAMWAVRHFFALSQRRAVRWVPDRNFAYLDELLRRWSPAWNPAPGENDAVKAIFRDPASLDAALGYYRALRPWPPSSHRLKITVPTVCFAGDTDILPAAAYERARSRFTSSYEVVQMPGGHFMHREHPQVFIGHLLRIVHEAAGDAGRSTA
jgi:pimeloyl-ACP methyl ester carboxylesterase